MSNLFMKLWEMAWEGSIVLLAVMLIRFALKKVPKKYMCFLWTIVLLRLCIPYLPQGPIPAFWRSPEMKVLSEEQLPYGGNETYEEQLPYSGNENYEEQLPYNGNETYGEQLSYNGNVTGVKSNTYSRSEAGAESLTYDENGNNAVQAAFNRKVNGKAGFAVIVGCLWLLGTIVALTRFGLQYFRIRGRLQEAIPVGKFQNYMVKEHPLPGLPAVLGVFHPCIYVPTNFATWEEKQKELILLHEVIHIKRKDHLLKLFSIFVLCLYWWNPIVWIGTKLLHCDIEMACDEGVLAGRREDSREAYAKVLLFHAVRDKQIALPIAFGENHTEGRIENILRYKKTSIAVSAALILLVGILVVCIGTKPRDVVAEETTEVKTEETIEKSIEEAITETGETEREAPVEASLEDLPPQNWIWYWENYWKERLVAEGKVKNPDEEIFFFENYLRLPGDEEGEVRRATLQAFVVDEAGNTSLYQSVLDDPRKAKNVKKGVRINIEGTEVEDFGVIDCEDIILKLTSLPFNEFTPSEKIDREGNKITERFIHILAERMKETSPENYKLLGEPETAAELLLHLRGSKEEFIYFQYSSGYLKYKLADGKQVILWMNESEGVWYPSSVLSAEWELDASVKEEGLRRLSECIEEGTYITEVTADTLRKVKDTTQNGMLSSYEGVEGSQNKFVFISKPQNEDAKNVDVALYGTYGGNTMVLRVGEKVYPIRLRWLYLSPILPVLYCGDFDGDGEMECAIKTHMRTGTGVSGDDLYVVELHGDTCKMIRLENRQCMEQLELIEYDYDSEQKIITLRDCDGNNVTLNIPLIFHGLEFGDIETFYVKDNGIYYTAEGGIMAEGLVCLSYEYSVEMTCPVLYSESEGFRFGGMKYTPLGTGLPE